MGIYIFFLGMASALILVMLVVSVVVMSRLSSKVSELKNEVNQTSRDLEDLKKGTSLKFDSTSKDLSRDLDTKVLGIYNDLEKNVETLSRDLENVSRGTLEESKSYTDSRVDKVLSKLDK